MKTGTVILYRTRLSLKPISWLSRAIQIITNCRYNHVAVIINDEDGCWIIEQQGKCWMRPASEYLNRPHNEYILLEPLFDFDENEFRKKMKSRLGKGYDVRLLFEQLWYQIALKFNSFSLPLQLKIWWGRKLRQNELHVCTEYIAYGFGFNEPYTYTAKTFLSSELFKEYNL